MQNYEETLFPVAYASRKMSDRESRYTVSEKECLAIVWAVQKFSNYLHGVNFILQTDHEALKYLQTSKFSNNRLMRWALTLQPYNINVQHIPGRMNIGADYLSRI